MLNALLYCYTRPDYVCIHLLWHPTADVQHKAIWQFSRLALLPARVLAHRLGCDSTNWWSLHAHSMELQCHVQHIISRVKDVLKSSVMMARA